MKIIMTHDIDHYRLSDHVFRDLYIPKYILKNSYFLFQGKISLDWYLKRMNLLLHNRMSRLEELISFNKSYNIPATFFMGVSNALNLSYNLSACNEIVSLMDSHSIPLNIHGINFENYNKIIEEKSKFSSLVDGLNQNGIRMHYLRKNASTLSLLEQGGYSFDSSEYALRAPYRIGQLIEFPVSMMEVYEMGYNESNFEIVKQRTLRRINDAERLNIPFFTIIFHDHHFSTSFPLHFCWYKWLIGHLVENKYQFCNFAHAISELP